ncbi:MAG TPA: alanine racemase [Pyrinomonadaceae bacterium]|nr:alanine racemase [Pyrinomonadaceae bacterium]
MSSLYSIRPTVAEINLDRLAFNFHSVKKFVGDDLEFMAVVKADAYGHGAIPCAARLESEGVDWFAVATVEEGVELRKARITKPILVLGGFWPGQEIALLNFDLTAVIFRIDQARSIAEAAGQQGLTAKVHVKIDTGMGRIGVRIDDVSAFAAELSTIENLEIEGLMTHFAAADDLDSTDFTNHQITAFESAVETFLANGHRPRYIDMANSPGAIVHPLSRAKTVRIGGLLYGLGGDVLPAGVPQPDLVPVMSIKSKIAQVKTLKVGEPVGYGRTWIAERDTVVATVPIGYHDGLPRTLSNKGYFLINSIRAPVIGRVSMDWTTVDVTDIPNASVGDDVTIIGVSGSEVMRSEDLAAIAATISYEITCGINQRVPRRY